jgi:glutamate synthase (NADPH/NADH) small chain
MEAEGVTFHYGVHVGGNSPGTVDPRELQKEYDALALTGGAEAARDLVIPGRDLEGIHFAMDFLPQQNRRVGNEPLGAAPDILAGGKHVVVIGGGDIGNAARDHAVAAGA